ncbi:MAG TPA: type I-E CRISPR-associated protein Cas5/CasD [Candidatus Sumerlaeota bacterium]|nr:type I-E CRISPR-associated protein Cas5/CasD [Candidatus Sumerlaeota bacterium]
MSVQTLFLRLEGPLQAWGDQESKFGVRRSGEAPTKSGVIGLLCAALGVPRSEAADTWLPRLAALRMGVRMDRPGVRSWDYHTVGAEMEMRTAEGKTKSGAMLTRREYLGDASFLVALQGEPALIAELRDALSAPKWTLYLGRKCCPPSRPILEQDFPAGEYGGLLETLASVPWRPRLTEDARPASLDCLLDWVPTDSEPEAPADALVWYDVPLTFDPPSHRPRFVVRTQLTTSKEEATAKEFRVRIDRVPSPSSVGAPPRPRADYTNSEYRKKRQERLDHDRHLCVFCKSRATTVQHITYRHAGGGERLEELRALCRLCHDAVTMIEYGLGMGLDRINPEEERWREQIIRKREEIIQFRSLETRRRKLAAEEVE